LPAKPALPLEEGRSTVYYTTALLCPLKRELGVSRNLISSLLRQETRPRFRLVSLEPDGEDRCN